MDRRGFCASLLLAGCGVDGTVQIVDESPQHFGDGMQTDFIFYKNPDKPLDLSHFGNPSDQFYNMGKTAASASGFILHGAFLKPVRLAHWWCAYVPQGGELELMVITPGVHDEEQLATVGGDNVNPIVRGAYITDQINAQFLKGERFLLTRGKGKVLLYSAVLSLVW